MKKFAAVSLALSGAALVALGVYCMLNPVETLIGGAWIIGLFTLFSGIVMLVFTFSTQLFLPNSGTRMLMGLLQVLLGILLLCNIDALAASLPAVFCIWIIVEGITLAIESLDFRRFRFPLWWAVMLLGACAAILGISGLRNPIAAGKTLAVLIGLGVALTGASYIVALFGVRRFEKKIGNVLAPVDEQ